MEDTYFSYRAPLGPLVVHHLDALSYLQDDDLINLLN